MTTTARPAPAEARPTPAGARPAPRGRGPGSGPSSPARSRRRPASSWPRSGSPGPVAAGGGPRGGHGVLGGVPLLPQPRRPAHRPHRRRLRRGRPGGRGGRRRGVAARRRSSRWLAIAGAVRAWALANPNEYALIYGSPVPGYAAPADTIGPAARPALVLLRVLVEGVAAGQIDTGGRTADRPGRARRSGRRCAARRPRACPTRSWPGPGRLDPAVRDHQLRAVRPPAQRDPRLRRLLRPRDASRRSHPDRSLTGLHHARRGGQFWSRSSGGRKS